MGQLKTPPSSPSVLPHPSTQTSGFLDAIKPPHVVLVHGEVTEMGRLKTALIDGAAAIGVPRNVYMPRNNQAVMVGGRGEGGGRDVIFVNLYPYTTCIYTHPSPHFPHTLQIEHKPLRAVRVVGRLAEKPPKEGGALRGVLVAPTPPAAAAVAAAAAAGGSFVVSTSKWVTTRVI